MEPLPGSPAPPEILRAEYPAWTWRVAYQHGPEALTYHLSSRSGEVRFLKLAPVTHHPSLADEAARMVWAIDYLPVPRVLHEGAEGELAWLVTRALPGVDATDRTVKGDPERLVPTLARGLRLFHAAPVTACPFDFRLSRALAHVKDRLDHGRIEPSRDFHPEFEHLSAREAVNLLESLRPTSEDLVVCHGDYCLPNVLVEDGVASGFVDLGEAGVADRWWDLAVATWSVTWNLGPGFEELFLKEYGVSNDDERMRFYRLLYDLTS